jgi:hypothetical protein
LNIGCWFRRGLGFNLRLLGLLGVLLWFLFVGVHLFFRRSIDVRVLVVLSFLGLIAGDELASQPIEEVINQEEP